MRIKRFFVLPGAVQYSCTVAVNILAQHFVVKHVSRAAARCMFIGHWCYSVSFDNDMAMLTYANWRSHRYEEGHRWPAILIGGNRRKYPSELCACVLGFFFG